MTLTKTFASVLMPLSASSRAVMGLLLVADWGLVSAQEAPAPSSGTAASLSQQARTGAASPGPEQAVDEVLVHAKKVTLPPSDLDRIKQYDTNYIQSTDAFTAEELLKTLPPAAPGTPTTVLIDGRETPLDLVAIPVEMIDHVEVNLDGNLPHGSVHVGGHVVNVILKQNYAGANANLREKTPFAGGGDQNEDTFSAGYNKKKLTATLMVSHQSSSGLTADERDFSRDQDHTAEGGPDLRLPWGYPAVVEAPSGTLNGVFGANGEPVSTALAPQTLPAGQLTPAGFIPGPPGVTTAAGLRRYNSSADLYLVSPSNSTSVAVTLKAPLVEGVQMNAAYSHSQSRSDDLAPPPVTAASEAAIVPAAYNPFGQDVEVGMVNVGFGAIRRRSLSDKDAAVLALDGQAGDSWKWNARTTFIRTVSDQASPELDLAGVAAALAAPDPANRFNPFADASPGSNDARLYSALTRTLRTEGLEQHNGLAADARGQVAEGWVGPLSLDFATEYSFSHSNQTLESASHSDFFRSSGRLTVPVFELRAPLPPATVSLSGNLTRNDQTIVAPLGIGVADTRVDARTFDGLMRIPWTIPEDRWAGLYKLDTQVGAGKAFSSAAKAGSTETLGVVWAPIQSLMFRGKYTKQQTTPPTTFFQPTIAYNQTLVDPQRSPATATDVEVIDDVPSNLDPSLSRVESFGLTLAPPALKGLSVELDYTSQDQENQVRTFTAQEIVDNEAALPGRVIRSAASATDIVARQPGAIASVDVTPANAGRQQTQSLDFSVEYRPDTPDSGISFLGRARYLIDSTNELLPGVPIVSSTELNAPPTWTSTAQANWKRGQWRAAGQFTYTAGGHYEGLAYSAWSSFDLRASYQFPELLWGEFGKGLQIGFGIENLFDTDPPQVDTIKGFQGGSPLGRTAQVTVRMPL